MSAVNALAGNFNIDDGVGTYIRTKDQIAADNKRVWDNTVRDFKILGGELSGWYNVKRLWTGKDPVTGEDANRWWAGVGLAFDVATYAFSVAKIGKGGKVAATAATTIDKVDDVSDATTAYRASKGLKAADTVDDVSDTSRAFKVADAVDDVGDIVKTFDIKDVNSFRGADIHDVEKYLDSTLKGYTKAPLKRGDGVRYFDGRGNSWQLNYGYPNATDKIHGGAYLKTTVGEGKVRIPLKGTK